MAAGISQPRGQNRDRGDHHQQHHENLQYRGHWLRAYLPAAPPSQNCHEAELGCADTHFAGASNGHRIEHVLPISVDGIHALDLSNYLASHPESNLALEPARCHLHQQRHEARPQLDTEPPRFGGYQASHKAQRLPSITIGRISSSNCAEL